MKLFVHFAGFLKFFTSIGKSILGLPKSLLVLSKFLTCHSLLKGFDLVGSKLCYKSFKIVNLVDHVGMFILYKVESFGVEAKSIKNLFVSFGIVESLESDVDKSPLFVVSPAERSACIDAEEYDVDGVKYSAE